MGAVLLAGVRLLPAVMIGTTAGMIAAGTGAVEAGLAGIAAAAACAITRVLLGLGKPIDLANQTVAATGRLALTSLIVYGLFAYVMGPYAIVHLTPGVKSATPVASSQAHAVHSTASSHPHAGSSADMHRSSPHAGRSPSAREPEVDHHPGSGHTLEWLLTDVIGIMLITPFVIYAGNHTAHIRSDLRERRRSAGAVFAVLIGVTLSIYSGYLENSFGIIHTTLLVLPPAVWLALEYGYAYTLIGNLASFIIIGAGTSLGNGPFKDHSAGLPLLTVVISFTTLLVAASRSERKTASETILRLATCDALTGVANRMAFGKQMEQVLNTATRYNRKLALMFIDLDRFKQVNDTLGHEAGDLLLVEVARRLRNSIRGDSVVGRFGGDEFVVLVDHVDSRESLKSVADRISATIADPIPILGRQCQVACSIGISVFPEDGTTAAELFRHADTAMYQIKGSGAGGSTFYSVDRIHVREPDNTNISPMSATA